MVPAEGGWGRSNKQNTVSLLTWSFETWGCTWRALSGTLRCFIYWPGWQSSWIISCRWSPVVDILRPQSKILFTIYIHIHHLDYSYRHIFRPWYSSLPPCVACWSSAPCVVWKNMLLANSAVAWFLLPWLLLLLLRERSECPTVKKVYSLMPLATQLVAQWKWHIQQWHANVRQYCIIHNIWSLLCHVHASNNASIPFVPNCCSGSRFLMFSHTMHRVFNSLTAISVWAGMKTPHSVDFTLWE